MTTLLCAAESPGSRASSSNYSASNYGTVGRPVSLPLSRQQRLLSSSDPDLPSASPESDMSTYSGQRTSYRSLLTLSMNE